MKIAVIGLGKLGSVIAAIYADAGFEVVGFDVDPRPVDSIRRREAPFPEPGLQQLIDSAGANLTATTDLATAVQGAHASFVIVPTPSNEQGVFSNDYLGQALAGIGEQLRTIESRHTVIICSTVMPGSCDGALADVLEEASGRRVGVDIGLVYSPEFIALGSIVRDMQFPDLVLIGESDVQSGDLAEQLVRTVVRNAPQVRRMGLVNAEIVKIAINTFVTTKISFANMLGEICERVPGGDVDVVTDAVGADSRIGGKYLKGALGYGGPCFPRDNIALTMFAESLGLDASIARATDAINDRQVQRMVDLVVDSPGTAQGVIAVLGLAYKPDTPVCEKSQGVAIANQLKERGLTVKVFDPEANAAASEILLPDVTVSGTMAEAVNGSDVVLLTTAWPEFASLTPDALSGKLVVDPWGVLDPTVPSVKLGKSDRVPARDE